jgi:hypothetical protein
MNIHKGTSVNYMQSNDYAYLKRGVFRCTKIPRIAYFYGKSFFKKEKVSVYEKIYKSMINIF